MAQNDLVIANQGFAAFRADLNGALQALGSTSKGTARPATPYAGQLWLDDDTPSATVWSLYLYDGTDDILLGTVDSTNNRFAAWGGSAARVVSKSGAYTLASAERGELHTLSHATGFTVTLLAAATATNGFTIGLVNVGVGPITLDGNAAETIDGQATVVLPPGQSTTLVCDGTNWRTNRSGHLPSAVSAHKNGTAQTAIAASTITKLTWSTEVFDLQSEFTADTFTAKVAGVYQASASVRIDNLVSTKSAFIYIFKNGADAAAAFLANGSGIAADTVVTISQAIQLAVGDTLDARALHNDTVARDASGLVTRTWFSIARVA